MIKYENRFSIPDFKIKIVGTPPLSKEYEEERNRIWISKVEEGRKVGKPFFNGELYRYMGVDNESSPEPVLRLGLMTYADRLMKTVVPIDEIESRYGSDHVMIHSCVDAIPVTTDGKIVYGVKKRSVDLVEGKVGYVSGNMNADEVRVRTFEDVYSMMMKELEEETSIHPDRKSMRFAKLGVTESWMSCYFIYELGFSSSELHRLEKDDEFDHFVAGTPEEIVNMNVPATSDFNYSKRFIQDLGL